MIIKFTSLLPQSILKEGNDSRIQHIEDLIFWDGSKGAKRALNTLINLQKDGYKNVTIKWDGSPAIVFGRFPDGKFVLTDKNGFNAKTYNGKTTSADDLEKMFLNRGTVDKQFASNMKHLFPIFESALPTSFSGFFLGDLLYFDTPPLKDNLYIIKPNIVTYSVDALSDLGRKIGKSKCGVVIHKMIDSDGNTKPLPNLNLFQGNKLLVVPPITVQEPPTIEQKGIQVIGELINHLNIPLDSMLSNNRLLSIKLSDFPEILYSYLNSKVDSGLNNLGKDFDKWVLNNSKITEVKKKRLLDYIKNNTIAFDGLWKIVSEIIKIKDDVIKQMDSGNLPVKSYIGDIPGGEGFVSSHPEGNIKLVPRSTFSAINRQQSRISEGGKIFPDVTPFKKEQYPLILKNLRTIFPPTIKLTPVGSAGHKNQSSDMDIMVNSTEVMNYFGVNNEKDARNELKNYFIKKGYQSILSGTNVHVRIPINNEFVQIDIMFVDNPDNISQFHQHDYSNSKYKGSDKQIVISSLAKETKTSQHPNGFIWSAFQGLKDRDTKQLVTSDINVIAKLLIAPDAISSDMRSVESILDKLSPEDKERKLTDARKTLASKGVYIV